jgi:hypothetical protein
MTHALTHALTNIFAAVPFQWSHKISVHRFAVGRVYMGGLTVFMWFSLTSSITFCVATLAVMTVISSSSVLSDPCGA